MALFFRVIWRLIVLAFAYVFACSIAMVTLVLSVIGWRSSFGGLNIASPEEEIINLLFSSAFGLVAFVQISFSAFMPALIAGLVTEAFSLRSWLIHLAIGGVLAAVLLSSANVYEGEIPPQQDMVIALAAGFMAGLAYWLIAGRRAGNWRETSR